MVRIRLAVGEQVDVARERFFEVIRATGARYVAAFAGSLDSEKQAAY
jgi:hypothetical protein